MPNEKIKDEELITKISISDFNQNISEFIRKAEKEVVYIQRREIPVIVMISKQMFDLIMNGYLESKKVNNGIN